MKEILLGPAIYGFVLVNPPVVEDAIVEASPITQVQYGPHWGYYRSPYRTYYPGPGYRTPYYGIPRQGYWGPRWQHNPYTQFHIWRGY